MSLPISIKDDESHRRSSGFGGREGYRSSVILEPQLQVSRLCSVPGGAGSRWTLVEKLDLRRSEPLRSEARPAFGGSLEWTGKIFVGCPKL